MTLLNYPTEEWSEEAVEQMSESMRNIQIVRRNSPADSWVCEEWVEEAVQQMSDSMRNDQKNQSSRCLSLWGLRNDQKKQSSSDVCIYEE